jgi:Uma2 family endonuclease
MVQPDVAVICQRDRLKRFGCFGAPDLVMEILSPSTARKDLLLKLQKYVHAGVREYWIIHPHIRQVSVYRNEDRLELKSYSFEDKIPVGIWEDAFSVDFAKIYERISFLYDLEE